MMLAPFNPVYAGVVANNTDAKRDSLCSVISINSALSLEYLENPADAIARLDQFEDGPDTELASNESTPMKDKSMGFDFLDDDAKSRKRRASHLQEPLPLRGEEILAALGDSSTNLFDGDDGALLFTDIDMMDLDQDNDGTFALPPVMPMLADNAEFERHRSQSSERRRIQNELLSRLERLDGIALPEENTNVIVVETKTAPSTPKASNIPAAAPEEAQEQQTPPRPEDPEPKLGIYTEKERIDRINAYREKRKQRVYGKVRYVLRQRVSENRPRVKGRFVKQNADATPPVTPDREQDATSSSAGETPKYSPNNSPSARRVEFQVDPIPSQESPPPKRGRSAWDMFKRLSIFRPATAKPKPEKRPSLPTSFSEKLLQLRRKSTTAASTASGRARRRFSRDEFFDDAELEEMTREPERKRATSMKKWDQ